MTQKNRVYNCLNQLDRKEKTMKITYRGNRPPWWTGRIYSDYSKREGVYTLILFNLFVRLIINTYYWIKFPRRKTLKEKIDRLEKENERIRNEYRSLLDEPQNKFAIYKG